MDNLPEQEAVNLMTAANLTVANAGMEPAIDKQELSNLQSKAKGFDAAVQRHHDAIVTENKRFRDDVLRILNDINQTHARALQTPAKN